jgi:hypothetical protein
VTDREPEFFDQPAPIVKKFLISIATYEGERINMLALTRCRLVESRAVGVVLHQDVAPQIHRAEMDCKVNIGQAGQLFDHVEREVLEVVGVKIRKAQCTFGNLPSGGTLEIFNMAATCSCESCACHFRWRRSLIMRRERCCFSICGSIAKSVKGLKPGVRSLRSAADWTGASVREHRHSGHDRRNGSL